MEQQLTTPIRAFFQTHLSKDMVLGHLITSSTRVDSVSDAELKRQFRVEGAHFASLLLYVMLIGRILLYARVFIFTREIKPQLLDMTASLLASPPARRKLGASS